MKPDDRLRRLEREAGRLGPPGDFNDLADAAAAEFARLVPDVLAADDAEIRAAREALDRRYGRAAGTSGFVRGMLATD